MALHSYIREKRVQLVDEEPGPCEQYSFTGDHPPTITTHRKCNHKSDADSTILRYCNHWCQASEEEEEENMSALLSGDDEDNEDEFIAAACEQDASANAAYGASTDDVESSEAMDGSALHPVVVDCSCSTRPSSGGRRRSARRQRYTVFPSCRCVLAFDA